MNESLDNKIVFRPSEDNIELDVKLIDETVWLTQSQMAYLFDKNLRTINEHVQNIFKDRELDKKSVIRNFRISGLDGKPYITIHYNLDVIISVGYRVRSQRGTQFRIWATRILRDYIVKGFAVNNKQLADDALKYKELQTQLLTLKRVYENERLGISEATGLIKVITDYANGLNLLDRFDHGKLTIPKKKSKVAKEITYKSALYDIKELRNQLDAGDLFGKERDNGFISSLKTIFQTFDGKDLYPSIEEKAANLLYLIVKNHSFVDGNKRIGSFMFVRFLDLNRILYKKNGRKLIEENALVAIALMIAQSEDRSKDLMVKLVINLIS